MKKLFSIVVLLILFTACKTTSPVVTSKKDNVTKSDKRKTTRLIDQIIDEASENLGAKYKYAGTTKEGYDCSGLICTIFKQYNISLPHSSYAQSKLGEVLNLKRDDARKGDLIFFKTGGKNQINHVGLVVDVIGDEIKFIHASTSKGVIMSSTKDRYYQQTFAQLNRIL